MTLDRQIQLDLASRLRDRRVELDLTLKEVAERAGLSIAYVSNLELARGNPTIKSLVALSEALEIPFVAIAIDRDAAVESVFQALIADGARNDGTTFSRAGAAVNALVNP